jgi:hypothetical protein
LPSDFIIHVAVLQEFSFKIVTFMQELAIPGGGLRTKCFATRHPKLRGSVSMSVMKMEPKPVLVTVILLVAVALFVLNGYEPTSRLPSRTLNNNPDHFWLFATNSAYEYHFVYDPLAADNWLRESCGLQSNLPFGLPDVR